MKRHETTGDCEWARRVNRSWIVRGGLADHAEEWLDHLAAAGDGREWRAAAAARAMCALRPRLEDPKPWFYAGLFSVATPAEARRFLSCHRATLATVPAMAGSRELGEWLGQVSGETRQLMARLVEGLDRVSSRGGCEKV